MPTLVILWGSAILGGVLGGVLLVVAFNLVWTRTMGGDWGMAPFPEFQAMLRGLVLGVGTGWAMALTSLGHSTQATTVRHGFGIAGLVQIALLLLFIGSMRLKEGASSNEPEVGRLRTLLFYWAYFDTGTLPWSVLLLTSR